MKLVLKIELILIIFFILSCQSDKSEMDIGLLNEEPKVYTIDVKEGTVLQVSDFSDYQVIKILEPESRRIVYYSMISDSVIIDEFRENVFTDENVFFMIDNYCKSCHSLDKKKNIGQGLLTIVEKGKEKDEIINKFRSEDSHYDIPKVSDKEISAILDFVSSYNGMYPTHPKTPH